MKADAAAIRFLLFKRGLTQAALAQMISVSRATINSVCAGRSCSYKTLEKVARALNTDPRQLILFEKNSISDVERQEDPLKQTYFNQDSSQTSSGSKSLKRTACRPPPAIALPQVCRQTPQTNSTDEACQADIPGITRDEEHLSDPLRMQTRKGAAGWLSPDACRDRTSDSHPPGSAQAAEAGGHPSAADMAGSL